MLPILFVSITPLLLSSQTPKGQKAKVILLPTYTVLSWRGNVKIDGRAPFKTQKFSSTARITFEKTSDALIVKTDKNEVHTFIPTNFAQKEVNGKKCSGPDCNPTVVASRVVAGTHHEFYQGFVEPFVAQFETPVISPELLKKDKTIDATKVKTHQTPSKANEKISPNVKQIHRQ